MGTSVSHRSPPTPNWNAVAVGYTSKEIPINRVVQEVWRAATNQPSGDLSAELSKPMTAKCLDIALNASSREDAVAEARKAWALSGNSSIAADLAQRAIIQSFKTKDRGSEFTKSLFATALDYLVSRDLPGYLGTGDRIKTISDSIAFKNDLRNAVVEKIKSIPLPANASRDPNVWQSYVERVVEALAGRVRW